MNSPKTPELQTTSSWEFPRQTPPPHGFHTPTSSDRREPRKPVPQRLNPKTMFSYTPPPKADSRPIPIPERSVDHTFEREYVQCMVCRRLSFMSSTAELVCSHYVHPRCLQQFVTGHSRKEPRDVYPPCAICQYPAKPKDTLLNQSIRTALLRSNQVTLPLKLGSRPVTPPQRSPRREVASVTSSCYSAHISEFEFEPYSSKLPIRLKVKPVTKSLAIQSSDPTCQFVVSVACPDQGGLNTSMEYGQRDERYSERIVTVFCDSLNCTRQQLGKLRMERKVEHSTEGIVWIPVKAYLFDHAMVLASPESSTPLVYTDIDENLLSTKFVTSKRDSNLCIELVLASKPTEPIYITSGNRDHLFSMVAAINDKHLNFPLVRNANSLLLQSPFMADYVCFPPSQTIICVPESISLGVVAEAVGRMRPFDKLGIVQYGNRIVKYPLNRQSWKGWPSLLSQPVKSPAFINKSNGSVIAAAVGLLDESSTTRSIVLINEEGTVIPDFKTSDKVPIYTLGLGSDHNAQQLAKIAAATGGHYTYASKLEDLPQYITNLILSDQIITHEDVKVTLKPRQGNVAGIFGCSSGCDNSSSTNVSESSSGNFVINIGRLRSGQTRSFIVDIDVDEKILKYTCDGGDLDLVEAIVDGKMILGDARVSDRKDARVTMEVNGAPPSFFKGVHLQALSCSSEQIETAIERIAVGTAISLDIVNKSLGAREPQKANAVLRAIISSLECTVAHLSRVETQPLSSERNARFFADILLLDCHHLLSNLNQKSTTAIILHMIWLLRSGRSFSRLSSLEAFYFDSNRMNVV